MNPTLQKRLTALRAILQSVVEASEVLPEERIEQDGDLAENIHGVICCDMGPFSESYARFIALSRNTSPQMARGFLTALDFVEQELRVPAVSYRAELGAERILKEFNL